MYLDDTPPVNGNTNNTAHLSFFDIPEGATIMLGSTVFLISVSSRIVSCAPAMAEESNRINKSFILPEKFTN
jgi:hypothetical protein